jgi:enamine deaminase RidA (YjgF/YER057c/UK114 family)
MPQSKGARIGRLFVERMGPQDLSQRSCETFSENVSCRHHNKGAAMPRTLISSGSPFEARIGYSRAVVQDGWIFVAGTTGYDYASMQMPLGVVDQCRNTLATIENALGKAGASLADVVRVRYILPDAADFEPCWPVLRDAFGTARPAATMIVAGLMTPEMKIEIEVTARLPAATPG